jgi:hypothetical protein
LVRRKCVHEDAYARWVLERSWQTDNRQRRYSSQRELSSEEEHVEGAPDAYDTEKSRSSASPEPKDPSTGEEDWTDEEEEEEEEEKKEETIALSNHNAPAT